MENETQKKIVACGRGGTPVPKSTGRTRGVPNKATQSAREAIALFVDGSAWRLKEWLDKVADGVSTKDGKGYKVDPNPQKAFELFMSVVEYHIPKLQRTDTHSIIKQEHSGNLTINSTTPEEAARAYQDLIK